ncbi:unnamed protein product [Peronospora belbahrii]|uniref:Uncharacterized protein n=1 Tax=Peronospora belbahrii TaxID=622444 RepID=A0AAU9KU89_9STRA|nr:unnamed protein product [Peronospora belbahrii]
MREEVRSVSGNSEAQDSASQASDVRSERLERLEGLLKGIAEQVMDKDVSIPAMGECTKVGVEGDTSHELGPTIYEHVMDAVKPGTLKLLPQEKRAVPARNPKDSH